VKLGQGAFGTVILGNWKGNHGHEWSFALERELISKVVGSVPSRASNFSTSDRKKIDELLFPH